MFVLTSSDFYLLVFIFHLLLTVLISVILLVYSVFFISLILLFVIYLLAPLFALFSYLVPFLIVVTCNYVITSTIILFKGRFYPKAIVTEGL